MQIYNSDLKTLLTLHNYLPQGEERLKNIEPDYIQVIARYEMLLINLLKQKIEENERTRNYILEGRNHG